jgi:hypothetical protein
MEAASENTGKRKRGRPPILRKDWVGVHPRDGETERGKANDLYAWGAFAHFRDRLEFPKYPERMEEFFWLFGFHPPKPGQRWNENLDGHFRQSVVAELGRIISEWSNGFELALKNARGLCQMDPKPTTKEAMLMLRRWRLGRENKRGNPLELLQRIAKTIDDYCDRYEMNRAWIADDLRLLADWIEEEDAEAERTTPEERQQGEPAA